MRPTRSWNMVFARFPLLALCMLASTADADKDLVSSAIHNGDDVPAMASPKKNDADIPWVIAQPGDLPIVLSAPHGGREALSGVPKRRGIGVPSFKTLSDFNTDNLTERFADAIEKELGKRPYVVIARFHRKYVDANRRSGAAFESENARVAYDAYHQALENACDDITKRWGRGLLLDIHGQSANPNAIIRGTQNGKTAMHLQSRFGRQSLTGEASLFGQLARQDLHVMPAVDSTDLEPRAYSGGHIVITYGSSDGGTIDAIQLEIGRRLRSADVLLSTAAKLSKATVAFANDYLPSEECEADSSASRQPIGIVRAGVYVDEGAGRSVNDLLRALNRFDKVSVVKLTAEDIWSGRLADFDVLLLPGGSGSSQGRHLGESGRNQIREFVQNGGGFIGICAGAYLASSHYPWSLDILDAKVIDTKHWNRGTGTVELAITEAGQKLLHTEKQRMSIHYAQGPLLAPGDRPDIEDYETVATFETEIAKKGAPPGVMKGTTAIARGLYGRGRVICFSPHPELTGGLEHLVQLAIDHVKRNQPQSP